MKEIHALGSGVIQPQEQSLMIGAAFRPGKSAADDSITLMFPNGAVPINMVNAKALHDALGVALGTRAHAARLLGEGSGQEDLRGPEDAES